MTLKEKVIEEAINRLKIEFEKAEINIYKKILKLNTNNKQEIWEYCKKELEKLYETNKIFAQTNIRYAYLLGMQDYFIYLNRDLKLDVKSINRYTNTKALKSIINSYLGDINNGLTVIGKNINDLVYDEVMTSVIEGVNNNSIGITKQELIKKLESKKIMCIRYKDGKHVNIKNYSYMVARTTTREATNIGMLDTITENGQDLVKISIHTPTCNICRMYQGRIYSISGKNKDYPPLSKAMNSYFTLHPNCKHVLTPYILETRDKQEINKDIEKSNKPFEEDDNQTKAYKESVKRQRDRYKKQQEKIIDKI